MCDEYYDARMRAFWRALEEAEAEKELEENEAAPLPKPIVLETVDLPKPKVRTLAR